MSIRLSIRYVATSALVLLMLAVPNNMTRAAVSPSAWSFPDSSFGSPATPLALKQNPALAGWDLLVHEMAGNQRAGGYGDTHGVPAFLGQHGTQCGVPTSGADLSGFHAISSLYGENGDGGMAFTCRDHLMLTNHCQPDCFGSTVLTLPMQLDWSQGPATFSFNMSTRHTADRDWMELFLTPFRDQLAYPSSLSSYEDNVGPPATGLGFSFGANLPPDAPCSPTTAQSQCGFDQWSSGLANWCGCDPNAGGDVRNGLHQTQLADVDLNLGSVEDALQGVGPTNNGRARFNLIVSKTHVTLGLAPQWQQPAGVILNAAYANGLNWVDSDLSSNPLPYNRAVVQFVAQDYAACLYQTTDPCNGTDTWHMSGFSMSSAVPLRIIRANQNWADDSTSVSIGGKRATELTFPSPAVAGSYLRTCFYGDPAEAQFSVDKGVSWIHLHILQGMDGFYACSLTPVPAGTQAVYLTGADKFWSLTNPWHFEGASIVSETP